MGTEATNSILVILIVTVLSSLGLVFVILPRAKKYFKEDEYKHLYDVHLIVFVGAMLLNVFLEKMLIGDSKVNDPTGIVSLYIFLLCAFILYIVDWLELYRQIKRGTLKEMLLGMSEAKDLVAFRKRMIFFAFLSCVVIIITTIWDVSRADGVPVVKALNRFLWPLLFFPELTIGIPGYFILKHRQKKEATNV